MERIKMGIKEKYRKREKERNGRYVKAREIKLDDNQRQLSTKDIYLDKANINTINE